MKIVFSLVLWSKLKNSYAGFGLLMRTARRATLKLLANTSCRTNITVPLKV